LQRGSQAGGRGQGLDHTGAIRGVFGLRALRYTPSGQPVARFPVASTPRFYAKQAGERKDGESLFLTCQVWRQAVENVAESVSRGRR
jgi:hypothetical protein